MFDKMKEFFNKNKCCVGFIPEFTTNLPLTARIEVGGEEYLIIPDPTIHYNKFREILREWSLSLEERVGFVIWAVYGLPPLINRVVIRYGVSDLDLSPFDQLKQTLIDAGLTPESTPPKGECAELNCDGTKLYVQVPSSRNYHEVYTIIQNAYCVYNPNLLMAFIDAYGKRDVATLNRK